MGVGAVVQGEVVRFDQVKGYGFIAPHDGGEDVFLHVNDLLDDKHLVRPGAVVEFVVETGDRGLKASSVHVVAPPHAEVPGVAARPLPLAPAEGRRSDPDDDLVDVLTVAEFQHETTELLLRVDPPLTGAQVLATRSALATMARRLGWIGS